MSNTSGQYKLLSAEDYFWLQILFTIPIVEIIFLIIFSLSNSNINRRNFARSYFCIYVITFIIIIILLISGALSSVKDIINNM